MNLFSSIDFVRPWFGLLIFLPLILPFLRKWKKRPKAAITFSDVKRVQGFQTWRTQTLFLPSLLAYLAWICLVIALMGPRHGHEETKITTEGIAVAMVMDVSGSMNAKDMPFGGSVVTRYEMVEHVFSEFVRGNGEDLEGRKNDMISLVVFGKYVDDLCPLTLDHDFVLDMMQNTMISVRSDIQQTEQQAQQMNRGQYHKALERKNPIWNGTAVFEGVALGADILKQSEASIEAADLKGDSNYHIKSKILIVLTDGDDNSSTISAEEAANVAKEFGVKIYSIAVHGKPVQRDILGFFVTQNQQRYDDTPLKNLAKETGGKFFQATNPDSLRKIYQEIDRLEKSEISKQVTMEYSPTHRPWLMAGLILLSLALIFQHSLYRVLP